MTESGQTTAVSISTKRYAFIGAGNMAEALIRGMIEAGTPASHIAATVKRKERQAALAKQYGITVGFDNVSAVKDADVVVLCVKPQAFDTVLSQLIAAVSTDQLVLSIAAGIPLLALERRFQPLTRLIRAMPNTPCLVGQGATAIAKGQHATEADLQTAQAMFEAVGYCTTVDEGLLDAVTGLSGSGPAYVFLVIEALSDAGVKVGLPRRVAQQLAAQTVMGSARMLLETGAHPGTLKDQVTSPGGTAIAGLHTLEAGGLRTTLMNAVEAATNRARTLGDAFLDKS
jgi:pyrroline-5-carboxylate reductase